MFPPRTLTIVFGPVIVGRNDAVLDAQWTTVTSRNYSPSVAAPR